MLKQTNKQKLSKAPKLKLVAAEEEVRVRMCKYRACLLRDAKSLRKQLTG
jgi:hypothetical protein